MMTNRPITRRDRLLPSTTLLITVALLQLPQTILAWSGSSPNDHGGAAGRSSSRRTFLIGASSSVAASILVNSNVVVEPANAAISQAIGVGESKCREAGNCLEIGEWDGAVGWTWGGKDRCDPSDPKCGPDGKLRDGEIVGKPVPEPVSDITHAVAIQLDVGRSETGILRLGLYGNEYPGSVGELVNFLSSGLSTIDSSKENNMMGRVTAPVALGSGGIVSAITPGLTVDFGVPSQSNAYGRSRGLSKVDDFVPQPRPPASFVSCDKTSSRSHDVAGLLSISNKGLGYGGTGFEIDDECYERSFLLTSGPVPSLDKSRRVVGQVLDAQSMAFLERLSTLPTKKGIKGVIPGQNTGPPLLKVVVGDVQVAKVEETSPPTTSYVDQCFVPLYF